MRDALVGLLILAGCDANEPTHASVDASVDAGPDTRTTAPPFEDVRAHLAAYASDRGIPGAAIAIVLDGKLAYSSGVGVKAAGRTDPVGPRTLFRVASLTKVVVAAAVMQLVEQGKLSVHDTLAARVPWLKLHGSFDPKTIELEHLLSHTSGLPDGLPLSCPVGKGALEAAYVGATMPLWYPPGRLFDYSNHNYALLGGVIEGLTGKVFSDVLKTEVLAPLGMATATFEPWIAMSGDHVQGHQRVAAGSYDRIPIDAADCAPFRAAGGLIASVEDYAHLTEAFLDGGRGVLGPKSIAAMTMAHANMGSGPDATYGYGTFAFRYRGLDVIAHDGALPGFASIVAWVPSRKMAVVVLANADVAAVDEPALYAIDRLLAPTDAKASRTTSPATWKRYVGTYDDPWGALGATTVTLAGDKLALDYGSGGAHVDLVQSGGDRFSGLFPSIGIRLGVTFVADSAGTTEYVVTRVGVARRTASSVVRTPAEVRWVWPRTDTFALP